MIIVVLYLAKSETIIIETTKSVGSFCNDSFNIHLINTFYFNWIDLLQYKITKNEK